MTDAASAAEAWKRITVPYIAQRPVMRRSPDGGRRFPRSSDKGYRYEVAIQSKLPDRPTAVPTFDVHAGTGRLLVLDLDVSRVPADGAADRAGYVAATAEQAVALVQECGGRALVDVSPSGGRHVYILWERALPFAELHQLMRAFALRLHPVVDTSPMESSDGQIRGPGSPHRSENGRRTGYMALTCPVKEAEEICARPCGPEVWAALQVELAAELEELAGGRTCEASHPQAPPAPLDTRGEQYWPRRGGRAAIRTDLEQTARTGVVDTIRYRSRSEARQAVLTSAASLGWRLDQVRAQLAPGGEWTAISTWWRDEQLLGAEWAKAVAFVAPTEEKVGVPVRQSNTSGNYLTPPGATELSASLQDQPEPTRSALPTDDPYDVKVGGVKITSVPWELSAYQRIRVWQQAMRIIERRLGLEWGKRALAYRAVLRAVGAAAQMTGATTIEFGTRQLGYMTGLDHTTVARALQALRIGPYALVDLVTEGRGTRADVYQLVVPDVVAADAAWRTWRPGRIEAIHPVFRVLGLGAAFAYEALSAMEMTSAELATAALLAKSTAHDALSALAEHGLAERSPGGRWRRGPADLDTVATAVGADELATAQLAGHRADRADWHEWLGIIGHLTSPATAMTTSPGTAPTPASLASAPSRTPGKKDRRAAPPWLVPPPLRRPPVETDVGWPAEALVVLAELRDDAARTDWAAQRPDLHAEVRAAIASDLAAITEDDEHLAAERANYEIELQQIRNAYDQALIPV